MKDDGGLLMDKYLHTMVVEGSELMANLNTLFETKKSFKGISFFLFFYTFLKIVLSFVILFLILGCEVKLVEEDIWLDLSAGLINEHLAIVVATDIQKFIN